MLLYTGKYSIFSHWLNRSVEQIQVGHVLLGRGSKPVTFSGWAQHSFALRKGRVKTLFTVSLLHPWGCKFYLFFYTMTFVVIVNAESDSFLLFCFHADLCRTKLLGASGKFSSSDATATNTSDNCLWLLHAPSNLVNQCALSFILF